MWTVLLIFGFPYIVNGFLKRYVMNSLPIELNDYVRDIYLFNLRYRVLRNTPMVMWHVYGIKFIFSSPSFKRELDVKIMRRVAKRIRKQISARSFYKSLKPRRFCDI